MANGNIIPRNSRGQFARGHKLLNKALETWRRAGGTVWNKGKSIQTNSGKTHFKLGCTPLNHKKHNYIYA